MTTFILVHGAWHGAWCWEATSAWLRDAGHEVWTPTLSDSAERFGESGRNIGLSDHIRDVTQLIDAHDLHDVILVGHSYAGMVVTGVADRRRERVRSIVYLDAFVPESGQRAADFIPAELNSQALAIVHTKGGGTHLPVIYDAQKFVDFDSARSAAFMAQLTPQPFFTYLEPIYLVHPPLAQRCYIDCTEAPLGLFGRFAAQARQEDGWLYREIASPHDAMLTHPAQLGALLQSMTSYAT